MFRHLRLVRALAALFVIGCGSSGGGTDAGSGGGTSAGSGGGMNAGSGGGGAGSGGVSGNPAAGSGASGAPALTFDIPTDTSADGFAAFLTAESYRTATWASDETGPTPPPSNSTSPHGLEFIWYNHALRQSKADGHTGIVGDPFAMGSMAVKEIYTDTTVVGRAAMLATATGWLYFCTSSESDRCFIGSMPNVVTYTTAPLGSCTCHSGGTIVTAERVPLP
jgi:hypothetical protein